MAILHVTAENFEQEVIASTEPVLVDFWAAWCVPCQTLGPVLEELALQHPNLKIAKIDVETNRALAIRFHVMSIPTIASFKDGKLHKRAQGVQTTKELLALLD